MRAERAGKEEDRVSSSSSHHNISRGDNEITNQRNTNKNVSLFIFFKYYIQFTIYIKWISIHALCIKHWC
jgi:hypothetical protein